MPARMKDFRVQLAGLTLVGLGVRVWAVLAWQRHLAVEGDQVFYHFQARALASGDGFVNPWVWNTTGDSVATALHPPAYSLYLAAWSLFGLDSPGWHKLASACLGAGTVLLIGLVAHRLAGRRAGLLAAGLAAVYPILWVSDSAIAAESLYAFLVAGVLLAAVRFHDLPSRRAAAWLGALIALATLTRAEALVLFVILVVPLVWWCGERDRREQVRLVLVAGVVGGALLAPWVVRNLVTFEGPSLVSNGAGFVIEIANCDETYGGEHLGYWDAACDRAETWVYEDRNEAARHETTVERAKRDAGVGYAREHVDRLPVVVAARVGRMWDVYRPDQNVELNVFFERRGRLPTQLGLAMYYALVPLAVVGLVAVRRSRGSLVPYVALAASVTLTAAMSFGITRYRIGMDVALCVLAAVGAVWAWDRLREHGMGFWGGVAMAAWVGLVVRFVNVLVARPLVETCEHLDDCFALNGDAAYGHLQGELLAHGHGFAAAALYQYSGRIGPGAGDPPLYPVLLGWVSSLHGSGGGLSQALALLVVVAVVGALVWAATRTHGRPAGRWTAGIGAAVGGLFVIVSVLPTEAAVAHRLASGMAGTAAIVAIGALGRRLGGDAVGLLAAAIAAVYPMLWINDGMLLSESLYVPLVVVAVLAAYRYRDRPSVSAAVVLAATVALAALTRAEAVLLFALVPMLAFAGRRRSGWRDGAVQVGWAAAAGAALMLPWFAYNLLRFEEPTFMTTGTGAVLSAGSCDDAFEGEFVGYYARCYDQYVADGWLVWPDPLSEESVRDVPAREGAVRYLKEHIEDLPRVMVLRVGRMWDLYKPDQNTKLNYRVEGRGQRASGLAVWMYAVLAPCAVGGLVHAVRRRHRGGPPVSPLVAVVVMVTVTAALSFGVTRYRAPADAVVVVLAALGIVAALRHLIASDDDRDDDPADTPSADGADVARVDDHGARDQVVHDGSHDDRVDDEAPSDAAP